jgi:hypothetical protein
VDRDEEYPETITIKTDDFYRLCEGYSYWYGSIHNPMKQRTYALLARIGAQYFTEDDK